MDLAISKLHPHLGAEVSGINLADALDEATVEALRAAWVEHCVLVFRDQDITDAEQIAFSRRFGELEIFPQADNRTVRHPEIFNLTNVGEDGEILPPKHETVQFVSTTRNWHTDSCYRAIPCNGAILHGIETTAETGNTLFADLRAAYDTLPGALRKRIDGLKARHSFEYMRSAKKDLPPMKPEELATVPPVMHPLVRTHPVSGRKSIYLSPIYMERIEGLDDQETRDLIEELTEWASQDRFVYRHKWRPDDVLMWDNRSTMHLVTPFDAASERRVMHRTTLLGTAPVA